MSSAVCQDHSHSYLKSIWARPSIQRWLGTWAGAGLGSVCFRKAHFLWIIVMGALNQELAWDRKAWWQRLHPVLPAAPAYRPVIITSCRREALHPPWAGQALGCALPQRCLDLWLCRDPTAWPYGLPSFHAWWSHVYSQVPGSFRISSGFKQGCFGRTGRLGIRSLLFV